MPRPHSLWLRAQPWVPLFAMLACAPALANGIELDDVFHAARAGEPGFLRHAFTFFGDGEPSPHVPTADLPWWTEPGMELDLLRPVAALTHALDYTWWPHAAWLMHLQSLLWYGLLVGLLQHTYRAFGSDSSRAALAALVFGLSQAHAMNVGWLAARNSVMGATFVTAMLLLHHRGRSRGSLAAAFAAPLLLALAVLANEGAVAGVGYLAAYAWVLDRGRRRWLALLPYVAVVITWRLFYEAQGAGVAHTGVYLEPTAAPLAYAAATVEHAVWLLAARLGVGMLDSLGVFPGAAPVALVGAVAFLAVLAWLGREHLREHQVTRAWALGMVLACFTAGTTLPTDRALLLLGLGGCMVVAELVVWLRREGASRPERFVGGMLVGSHLVLSPLLLPLRVRTTAWIHGVVEHVAAAMPTGPAVAQKTVLVLDAPSDLLMLYSRALAEERGEVFPARVTWLYAGPAAVTVTRTGSSSFELAAEGPWLAAPIDRMFRADLRFATGQRFPGECLTAEIVAVNAAALPIAVRFELHDDRPECSFAVLAWSDGVPRPFALPEPGTSQRLPPARP